MARSIKKKLSSLTPRSSVAMAHSLRGGAGAGKHHTRALDVAKGRSRKPKHGGRRALLENPLSGLPGLHVEAHRLSPSKKYGSEFTQSYGVMGLVPEVRTKKSGEPFATFRRRVNWRETAQEFLADYEQFRGSSVYDRIFAIDEDGKQVDLSLSDVLRMAEA